MLENYKILTVTHHNVSVKDIGKFVVQHTDQPNLHEQLLKLKEKFRLDELMYLATCNRVTYIFTTDQAINPVFQYNFFRAVNPSLCTDLIEERTQLFEGTDALHHLFSVAASIDSMVVGEREILRQLREAYDKCYKWKLTGDDLRLALNAAVQNAKDIYSNTRIGEKPVSIVSLAIQRLLEAKLSKDARILLVGAGQTNILVSKFLSKHQFENITIFNRTFSKAQDLAKSINGRAFELAQLENYREGFDCMIVCTGALHAIITPDLYEKLLIGERGSKLVIDLAIPNNVDKEILDTENSLHYIEIDDLRCLAKENLAFRETEVKRAKELMYQHLEEFPVHYQQRLIERAMKTVPSEIKAIKAHAMNNVFKKEVDVLDNETRLLVERIVTYMEKKCIGIPMKAAREAILS